MPNLPLPEELDTTKLECVMLKLAPLKVPNLGEDDLFYGETPELKYAQGIVGHKAHVTLLFGIHPSADYHRNVDAVLAGWEPEPIYIDQVSTFPIRDEDQEYYVVKGDVLVTKNLLEARARLEVLDHTDGFPEYHPHVTLAYVKRSANVDKWVSRLHDEFAMNRYEPEGIDYGDD